MGRGGTFLFAECFSSILVIASVVWSGLIAPYRLNIVNGLTGGHQSSLKLSTFEGWQFFLTICFLSIIGILVFCLIWSDRPILSEHCKWGNGGRQCNLGVRSSNQKLRSSEWGKVFYFFLIRQVYFSASIQITNIHVFPNSFHSFHKNVENYWKLPNSFHSFHKILVSWTEVNPFPFCENCENYWVVFNSFRHACENCENDWEKRTTFVAIFPMTGQGDICICVYIYIYKYMYAPHAEHCATWNRDIE